MRRISIFVAGSLLLSLFAGVLPAHAQLRVDGEPVRLETPDRTLTEPEWSPEGSRIAASGGAYSGIYVVDVESGAIRSITDDPGAGYGFSWAPDGQTILARVARFDGPRRTDALVIYDTETAASEQLTDFRDDLSALPRWDASGDRVFLYANDRLEVYAVRGDLASKTDADERTEWVAMKSGIASVSLAREEVRPARLLQNEIILNVTPSPDGSRVAFEVLGGNLFVTDGAGTNLIDLGTGNRPSWSPDGQWIAYMRTEDDGHTFTQSDLYAVRADGSRTVRLTDTVERLEMNPAWSPDGSRIAFDDLSDGSIYLLPVSR